MSLLLFFWWIVYIGESWQCNDPSGDVLSPVYCVGLVFAISRFCSSSESGGKCCVIFQRVTESFWIADQDDDSDLELDLALRTWVISSCSRARNGGYKPVVRGTIHREKCRGENGKRMRKKGGVKEKDIFLDS